MTTLLHDVERRMMDVTADISGGSSVVTRAVHYHLSAGGSRIRTRFCLHACLQLDIPAKDTITLATICELLHNASLIQDDLIDRASPRRGVPSVWAVFGDNTALCAGDLLLASAFSVVADLDHTPFLPAALRLVQQRTREVILGQGAENEPSSPSLRAYEELAQGKSAPLLSLPLELPLLLSRHAGHLQTAQQAANTFATAYQMADDLQDYQQDREAGSLNAVSVALASGAASPNDARDVIRFRAIELLASAIRLAMLLPQDCGGLLITQARGMLTAFHGEASSDVDTEGVAQYAR